MYSQFSCKQDIMVCSQATKEIDTFKNCYTFPCSSQRHELWSADGIVNPCGTFILSVESSCLGVAVYINDQTAPVNIFGFPGIPGESVIITSDPLTKIEAQCNGSGGNCKLKLCVILNYECC